MKTMKTPHLLGILAAVLLLTVFSCKKENEVPDEPVSYDYYTFCTNGEKSQITAKALTPTVSDDRNTLESTWTGGDVINVYKGGNRVGTLTVRTGGITGTMDGKIDNSVKIGDVLTLKYQSPSYSTQNGTLTGNAGSIDKVCDYSTATVTVSDIVKGEILIQEGKALFESQQAIVKLTLLEGEDPGTAISDVRSLVIDVGGTQIDIVPMQVTNVFYVAVPAIENAVVHIEAYAGEVSNLTYSYEASGFTFEKSSYYELKLNLAAPRSYYFVTSQKTYANQDALLTETGYDISSVQGFLDWIFPNRNAPVSAISYTYRSADPQGNPTDLSGIIYIPDSALNGTTSLTGIALTNHGTIASNAECPTKKAQLEGAMAWKNYAIIMPDYYGFGVSASKPQAYLDPSTTARGNIDACLAAFQILKDRSVTIPGKLYSFGYSQGGFNSMANLKYVSEHPELGITFEKVMCGGSPFDVEQTWSAYTQGTFHNVIGFVPLTVVSINETHSLGLDYATLFKGALLSNWETWILSKQYTLTEINNMLGTDSLSDILNDDFISGRNASYEAVVNVCRSYSLISGWTPPSSGTKIILYHSRQDDTVPFANFTAMKTFLDGAAPGSYSALEGDYGGHFKAALYFIVNTINEW